jgi:hypothetical protein
MNKNRVEGAADQGERANDREALVIKGKRRRSGGRAVKECVLTWGDLALCLKGRRRLQGRRSEESAEVVAVDGKAAKLIRRRRAEREGVSNTRPMWRALRQMPAQAGRFEEGHREAVSHSGSDEARRPRHGSESTGSS